MLADGTFVRATDDSDSDLLWAARGGGGGFGVVTAMEFELLPVRGRTPGCSRGTGREGTPCCGPGRSGPASLPETFTSVARLFRAPDGPGCRPRRPRAAARRHRRGPARGPRGGRGCSRPCEPCGPRSTPSMSSRLHPSPHLHLDPEAPTAVYANSVLLDDLPETAIEALVAAAGPDSGSALLFVEIRQLGGALARPAARAGVLDHLDGSFLVLGVGDRRRRRLAGGTRGDQAGHERAAALGQRDVVPLMADEEVDERRGWSAASCEAPRGSPRSGRPAAGCSSRPDRGRLQPTARSEAGGLNRSGPKVRSRGPAHRGGPAVHHDPEETR